MRIDTAHLMENTHQPATESGELRVIQIEAEDAFEHVLMALRLQSKPTVLLLPEGQSQAFSDPSHFAQVREVSSPKQVSFLIPPGRLETLACSAHHYGFAFASSLQEASQFLTVRHREQRSASEEEMVFHGQRMTDASPGTQEVVVEHAQQDLGMREGYEPQTISTDGSPQLGAPLQQSPPSAPDRFPPEQSVSRQRALVATLVTLLGVAGALLLPALFSGQPELLGTRQAAAPGAASVGQIAFTSSGQLDPTSSKGLNDTIIMSLHHLPPPAAGQSYYAWLMPDLQDKETVPLLLGRLSITGGKAQLTYIHPNHENLLAVYSGFEVAEQSSTQMPRMPPLDPKAWRSVASIPNTPPAGDEQGYSLLSHLRHLLAKDPTLQHIGLQGGLETWLYRNAEKILEWSSAARDSWAGGQQTDLIHRHLIRVLDDLDGTAYVSTSGDIPPGSPLLVDPQVGRIGLLEVSHTQALPAYLTHVHIHLQGLMNAPGHTQSQRQRAIKIDNALKMDTSLFQKVRQDAIKLVKMDARQLQSKEALSLLNEMVTTANLAYTGQFDPASGGNMNGVAWIHSQLQGLATMPVTLPREERA